MKLPALVLGVVLSASGLAATVDTASSAELAISPAHRAGYVYRTGYVFWDDVYPPAIYGPYLKSVEEVQALKAQAQPVSARWWYGWYR